MKTDVNLVGGRIRFRGLVALLLLVPFLSCSASPELEKNNDPKKYRVARDVLWASPGGFDLTMDISTPEGVKATYPVIVIFHGGGWLINDKSIMDQTSAYFASNSEYVVCNVDYRLLSDSGNSVTLDQIVEDVFGAVLWVKSEIARYQGDSSRVAVTGDSAGGHLSAMIVNMGDRLGSDGFSPASHAFEPSYLPAGMSA